MRLNNEQLSVVFPTIPQMLTPLTIV